MKEFSEGIWEVEKMKLNRFKCGGMLRRACVAFAVIAALATTTAAAFGATVAQIGGTEYDTLAAAVKAAQSGDTITMLANSSEGASVAAGKAITIDLKGFVLNGQIEYKGDLTLTDSVGTGYIQKTTGPALTGTGNLVLKANIGASEARSMDGVYATNGKVTIATDIKIYVSGEGIHCEGADLTITGEPTVDVRKNYDGTALNIEGKSTVSIAGGTYWGDAFALWGDGEGQNIIVTGGKFKAYNTDNDSVYFWGRDQDRTVAISGGIYADDSAKEYLASGCEVVDNPDSATKSVYPYAVVQAAQPVAQVTVGGVVSKYADLHEALEAAKASGAVCELLSDVDLTGKTWTPVGTATKSGDVFVDGFMGTFDGRGYTISGLTVDGAGMIGLIGFANEATIKNVTITGASVTGTGDNVAVLAGGGFRTLVKNVTITNSTVSTTGEYAAAITGGAYTDVFDSRVVDTQITGKEQVGGVIGYACGAEINNNFVSNVTVTATAQRAGLLVGKYNEGDGKSTVLTNVVQGTVVTPTCAGGLIGQLMGSKGGWLQTFEIRGNAIDATLTTEGTKNPIGILRDGLPTEFTSVLSERITGNTWTKTTLDADSF